MQDPKEAASSIHKMKLEIKLKHELSSENFDFFAHSEAVDFIFAFIVFVLESLSPYRGAPNHQEISRNDALD